MTFTLDTSGYVQCPAPDQKPNESTGCWFWPDLDPFTQGYIEGMWASFGRGLPGHMLTGLGYDDLAPETLAAILKDCAEYRAIMRGEPDQQDFGARTWTERQAGNLAAYGFPPLTPYLGDDGHVYLREAAQ